MYLLCVVTGGRYSTVVEFYYGHCAKRVFDVVFILTLQSYNIASVVICAQSVDQFFILVAGRTYALCLWPAFGPAAFDDIGVLYSSSVRV